MRKGDRGVKGTKEPMEVVKRRRHQRNCYPREKKSSHVL